MAGRSRLRSQRWMAFAEAALSHWMLISFVTVLAGAITYTGFVLQPRYTSTALLSIDEANERIAESIMRSTAVTESVLTKFPDVGATSEQRKRYLQKNLRIAAAMSGRTTSLYEMQVTHRDPATARQIASDLIDRWLELTKPRAVRKAELEADLARYQALENELSSLLKRLGNESTSSLVYPDSFHGELATPIHALTEKRDEAQKAIAKTKAQLEGTPRDVIMVAPNLPTERSSSAGEPALLVSCLVLLLMLAFAEFRSVLLPKWRDNLAAFKAERSRKHQLHPMQTSDVPYRPGFSQQKKEQDESRIPDGTRGTS
jgi:hypothetical protein